MSEFREPAIGLLEVTLRPPRDRKTLTGEIQANFFLPLVNTREGLLNIYEIAIPEPFALSRVVVVESPL